MIIPPFLKSGNKIGIVAPARQIQREELERSIQVFSSWGLEVVLGKHIFSNRHSYLSGTDDERHADFQSMINDKSIKAIVSGRGGYGSTRILDDLDFSPLQKHPKWIVGFSDITAVHLKLLKEGLQSLHATMPLLFSKSDSPPSIESLRKVLFEGECKIEGESSEYNRPGTAVGQVVGGNLSLIADSLGTSTELETNERILFIEEIDEPRYKLDRMMTQLRRAGKLKDLSALIVGYMTDIRDINPTFGDSVEEVVLNAIKGFSYPVAFRFPSGHENPNMAWIHGGVASLVISEKGTSLEFERMVR